MDATASLLARMEAGDFESVGEALAQGADPNAATEGGLPLLSLAARANQVEAVMALLGAGADPLAGCRLWQSPLHWAAEGGADACVMALLPKSKPNDRNLFGQTALAVAAGKGLAIETLSALAAVTDETLACDDRKTPLHYAAAQGDVAMVRLLATEKSARARAICGNRPLGLAAQSGQAGAILALLPLSDANSVDSDGRSPLDWLVKRRAEADRGGEPELRALKALAKASNPDRHGGSRSSAFELAVRADDEQAALVLAKRSERSGLIVAIASKADKTARALCKQAGQLTRKGFDDRYPLEAMAKADNAQWVEIILQATQECGAKLDVSRALEMAGPQSKLLIQAWRAAQEEKAILQACAQPRQESSRSARL